jgi:succinate dehydrogenase/fumarate reductase cytochrome b subunit
VVCKDTTSHTSFSSSDKARPVTTILPAKTAFFFLFVAVFHAKTAPRTLFWAVGILLIAFHHSAARTANGGTPVFPNIPIGNQKLNELIT